MADESKTDFSFEQGYLPDVPDLSVSNDFPTLRFGQTEIARTGSSSFSGAVFSESAIKGPGLTEAFARVAGGKDYGDMLEVAYGAQVGLRSEEIFGIEGSEAEVAVNYGDPISNGQSIPNKTSATFNIGFKFKS